MEAVGIALGLVGKLAAELVEIAEHHGEDKAAAVAEMQAVAADVEAGIARRRATRADRRMKLREEFGGAPPVAGEPDPA